MVRVTTSPAAGCGTASSRISKCSRRGAPSGRCFSTIERRSAEFWLIGGSMRLVGDARYCASRRVTSIFVRAFPNFAAGLVCVALPSWFGSEFPTCAAPTLPAPSPSPSVRRCSADGDPRSDGHDRDADAAVGRDRGKLAGLRSAVSMGFAALNPSYGTTRHRCHRRKGERSEPIVHAASLRSTSRPVTRPSRRRISASLAWLCGTVATGSAGNVPVCASATSSRSSFGLPT